MTWTRFSEGYPPGVGMEVDPAGEWVRYDAVRELLAPHCNYDCDACRASAERGECYDCELNPGLCDFHDGAGKAAVDDGG